MSKVRMSIRRTGFILPWIRSRGEGSIDITKIVYNEAILDFLRFAHDNTTMFEDREGRWVRVDKLEDFISQSTGELKEAKKALEAADEN